MPARTIKISPRIKVSDQVGYGKDTKPISKGVNSSSINAAKKSFLAMLDRKIVITKALSEGKSLREIKGIKFVKPF